jgi:uncharacterized protein YndB with AHSA1/START domain
MQRAITQTWQFEQKPEEVWDYLTKPELIEQWLMKTDFKPVKGHQFRFTFDPKPGSTYRGVVNCEVKEVIPFTKLSYTWNGSTADQSRTFNSLVVWTLVPNKNGTELRIQHDGFVVPEDMLNHESGWKTCGQRLEKLLNEKEYERS